MRAQGLLAERHRGAGAVAERLNADLDAASHDKHLHVEYSPDVFPLAAADAKPDPEQAAFELAQLKRVNYGFDSVQRLPFNIGYFKLDLLMPPAETQARFVAAMTLLQDTRALVIDLRENHGGEPATVALLCSYLFDQRTHLNDIWHRQGNRTDEAWTTDKVSGPRYGAQREVIVLTSHETFSAGEDLAYALKTLHRATLIGETTGGGGPPRRHASHRRPLRGVHPGLALDQPGHARRLGRHGRDAGRRRCGRHVPAISPQGAGAPLPATQISYQVCASISTSSAATASRIASRRREPVSGSWRAGWRSSHA